VSGRDRSEPTRAFVTGINGFAGSWLAELLLEEGYSVYGLSNNRTLDRNIAAIHERLGIYYIDILDSDSLLAALGESRPDMVFHLAAMTSSAHEQADPQRLMSVNVVGTFSLLRSLSALGREVKVLNVGSSAQYGAIEVTLLDENAEQRPASFYSATKVMQEMVARSFLQKSCLSVYCARAFNHTGPRELPAMACSQFAKQVASIKHGRQEPVVRVGNLDAYRDLSDVRDIVRGYLYILTSGTPGEVYNVCSGRAVEMRSVLESLLGIAGVDATIEERPGHSGPIQTSFQCGSPRKLRRDTGWESVFSLEQTLEDLLNHWSEEIVQSTAAEGRT
jgi:GDP-4-dehydro-6-deoxy-D-mannose reductase